MSEWRIERLDRSHQRDTFRCGQPPLDEFMHRLVNQYEKRNLGRTYVAVRSGEKKVCGYFTLASGATAFENLPASSARKLPRHPVPVVLLARLAVDQSAQGQGLGEALLLDALQRCLDLTNEIGIHAVRVDAIDEQARAFYERYGFVSLLDHELHLFLSAPTIRDALQRFRP